MRAALWHVYLLECGDGSYYCGVTNNLERRMAEHNGKKAGGARFTRARRPIVMRACLPCRDRRSATRAEARVKAMPRDKKLAFFGEA